MNEEVLDLHTVNYAEPEVPMITIYFESRTACEYMGRIRQELFDEIHYLLNQLAEDRGMILTEVEEV